MLSAKVALQKQGAERPITLPMYLDHTVGGIEHWFTGLVWVLTGRFLTLKKVRSPYGIFNIKKKNIIPLNGGIKFNLSIK